jgi:hypothetical protein
MWLSLPGDSEYILLLYCKRARKVKVRPRPLTRGLPIEDTGKVTAGAGITDACHFRSSTSFDNPRLASPLVFPIVNRFASLGVEKIRITYLLAYLLT